MIQDGPGYGQKRGHPNYSGVYSKSSGIEIPFSTLICIKFTLCLHVI